MDGQTMINDNKIPLIILTGPTAVGKTALSIALAKAVNGEMISADSMQVYKGMDIGTAKVTKAEMAGIPHHLIDILEPDEGFHVVTFQKLAREAVRDIHARGKVPIVVGGTGFYIQALLYDIDFSENDADTGYREHLEALAKEQGVQVLHEMLRRVDPAAAEQIHANNKKRVIRALEYYEKTGEQISKHNAEQHAKQSPYHYAYFVLNDDRKKLYQRIERRIDEMMAAGLVDEVKRLQAAGCRRGMVSMEGLGYKEILAYLEGECTLEEAVYVLKRDTRHFAKRQLTWFKRERDVIWLDRTAYEDDTRILEEMLRQLRILGIC